jgi:hypothetical protein
MAATLVYRSSWSPCRPSVYTDDCENPNVNKLIDAIFKRKPTNRLVFENNKMYYCPSDDYKKVVRLRKIR